MSGEDETIFEATNQYGFTQTYLQDGTSARPICSSCHALVMPNMGQGTLCDQCSHDIFIEMSIDYDEGHL